MSHLRYVRGKSVDPTKYTHLPLEVNPEIEALKDLVFSHPAVKTLEAFGENLASRPLTRDEVRMLLASEGYFVLEVPPGVLALSSRITDECFETDPFQAPRRARAVRRHRRVWSQRHGERPFAFASSALPILWRASSSSC